MKISQSLFWHLCSRMADKKRSITMQKWLRRRCAKWQARQPTSRQPVSWQAIGDHFGPFFLVRTGSPGG